MGDNDRPIRLPWRIQDFLSGTYQVFAVGAVVIGLISWGINQQIKINYLEERDKQHPTKQELSETAIRVEGRLSDLEKHLNITDDSISKRVTLLDERMNSWIPSLRQIDIVATKQEEVYRRLDRIENALNEFDRSGERGGRGIYRYPDVPPPINQPQHK